jgi:hypothetical protein
MFRSFLPVRGMGSWGRPRYASCLETDTDDRWGVRFAVRPLEIVVAKKKTLSEHQIHLIAKALADPRRHEILQQIGASKDAASCTDIRGCQPVTAATLSDQFK